MARVYVSTYLGAPPEAVWEHVQRYSTLRHIMRGLLAFSGPMPENVRPGDSVKLRLWFFHVLPGWNHTIGIEAVDASSYVIQSRESGGIVNRWDHRIIVQDAGEGRTLYIDEIEIEAGVMTVFVCIWGHFQYRYRQWRWRGLAKHLTSCSG